MGVLQFLVIASIFNIHLKLVQLKDLTGDHHVNDISKSISASNSHAERYKSSFTRDPLKYTQVLQPTFKIGGKANKRYGEISSEFLLGNEGNDSLPLIAGAVLTVPFDLNTLSDPTINSSNRHHLSSTRSLSSLPPCTSDQFACADQSK